MKVRLFCLAAGLLINLPAFAADTSPPTQPSVSDDGVYTSSSNSLHMTWTSSDSGSGIAEYQYRIRRDSTSGNTIVDWTSAGVATAVTRTGLSLVNGKKYFVGVRAKNGAGLWSSTGYSNGITMDTTSPSPVSVTDDGASTASNTQLHATWTASSDSGSGLLDYQYLIRQDSTSGAIIVNWTSVGLSREVSRAGLSLIDGKTYFVGVRAKNGAGLYSSSSYSNGITVQSTANSTSTECVLSGVWRWNSWGEGKPIYRVTNLSDSGPGSFRDALSQGNRYVVFDVWGEIQLASTVSVRGAFVTIDGFTAPSAGITLKNFGLSISGERGAHDVIVRGIRVRAAGNSTDTENSDGINIIKGAYNVVINHVSIHGSEDGNLDITDSHDVTVSWSIFAEAAGSGKSMLIKYNPARITLHHNLFVKGIQRNPHVRIDDSDSAATDTTLDMRNNLIWEWGGGYGSEIRYGPWANLVNNFYANAGFSTNDKKQAIIVCKDSGQCDGNPTHPARAYVAGNFSNDGFTDHLNSQGTESMPFASPAVDTTDAVTACRQVVANAGVEPLDAIDQLYLSLVSCP